MCLGRDDLVRLSLSVCLYQIVELVVYTFNEVSHQTINLVDGTHSIHTLWLAKAEDLTAICLHVI